MEKLSLHLVISLLLSVGIIGTVSAEDVWNRGENRLRNSDFEADSVGEPPAEWELEKGG